eukprot:scaffold59769_cov72-Phaeocystis_antarctica.AAC.1
MLRQLAACGATAIGGVAFGVAYSEHPLARVVLSKLSPTAPATVDAGDPQSLVAAAVRLSNDAGGLCVLSTRARDGGVSSRMVQPLPAVLDSEGSPSLLFHTTSKATKFAERLVRSGIAGGIVSGMVSGCGGAAATLWCRPTGTISQPSPSRPSSRTTADAR